MIDYVYVDGESHYIRSEHHLREITGKADASIGSVSGASRPMGMGGLVVRHHGESRFFWDEAILTQRDIRPVRSIYFTAAYGADEELHAMRVFIRARGFEPNVVKEDKNGRKNRDTSQKLTKPKGVDIALATRLIQDAHYGNYDRCLLFTSDADYLPVIHAVRQMGKQVWVFGFLNSIQKSSELLWVPDSFINLENHMKEDGAYKAEALTGKSLYR